MKASKLLLSFLFLSSTIIPSIAQDSLAFEGYVLEKNNRGYLKKAKVKVLHLTSDEIVAETVSNADGIFKLSLPAEQKFRLIIEKKLFFSEELEVSTIGKSPGEIQYLKVKMERRPGYVFDVTIAEPTQEGTALANAIDSARIEVFNNTTQEEELVLLNWPHPIFKFTFEQGNHYTIMIRRKGFFNKRIEAYVNVEGCILCFEGLGTVEPGVVDVMSHGNKLGTFLANIELEPLMLNQTYALNNIYYDYDKWDIRSDAAIELDNLVSILKDNPAVIVELGSHTDSRGRDEYNLSLSDKRAESAVQYIINSGVIDQNSIVAKGYGESNLVNACRNGVACNTQKHQENRRTELKVIGINEIDPLENKSLKQIVLEEKMMEEIMNTDPTKIENTPNSDITENTNKK